MPLICTFPRCLAAYILRHLGISPSWGDQQMKHSWKNTPGYFPPSTASQCCDSWPCHTHYHHVPLIQTLAFPTAMASPMVSISDQCTPVVTSSHLCFQALTNSATASKIYTLTVLARLYFKRRWAAHWRWIYSEIPTLRW